MLKAGLTYRVLPINLFGEGTPSNAMYIPKGSPYKLYLKIFAAFFAAFFLVFIILHCFCTNRKREIEMREDQYLADMALMVALPSPSQSVKDFPTDKSAESGIGSSLVSRGQSESPRSSIIAQDAQEDRSSGYYSETELSVTVKSYQGS